MRQVAAAIVVLGLIMPASAEDLGSGSVDIPNPVVGTWLTDDQAEITIAPCEKGLCGYLSKIVIPEDIYFRNKDSIDAIGIQNLTDDNNPNPELKTRPLLGMPMITLHTQISPVRHEGELYNPEDGQTYFGKVELADWDTLLLRGCLGWLTFACANEDRVWKRVPEEEVARAMENRDTLPDNAALWDGPPDALPQPQPAQDLL